MLRILPIFCCLILFGCGGSANKYPTVSITQNADTEALKENAETKDHKNVYTFDYFLTIDEFNEMIEIVDEIEMRKEIYLFAGVWDFKNIPIKWVGESECRKHNTARHGEKNYSTRMFNLRDGTVIKNLNIINSSQDGIDIHGNVKMINSKILSACDEAVTLREGSSLKVIGGEYRNKLNKGFIMKDNSELIVEGAKIVAQQAIASCGTNNKVQIQSSKFYEPRRTYGQVFSGNGCEGVTINWGDNNSLGSGVTFNAIEGGGYKIIGKKPNSF